VIGNGDYLNLGRLKNPVNDARRMSARLKKLGFEVLLQENVRDVDQFLTVTRQFTSKISPGSVALIYYAGHGVQVNGVNYLIPTGVKIQSEKEIPYKGLNLEDLIGSLQEGKSRLNLLILDACRDNPFVTSNRNLKRGLAIVQNQPDNFLVAYATAPGKTASDGDGDNGLYTQELIKAIETPGLGISELFMQVRRNVKQLSGGGQIPEERSVLEEQFYFNPLNRPIPTPVTLATALPQASSAPVSFPSPRPTPEPTEVPSIEQDLLRNSLGMEFKLIPAGSFMRENGSQVTLTQSFYMQTTEVTQGQWKAVMGNNPSHFKGDDNLPVEQVSWEDIQQFIAKLRNRDGSWYELPTEAEWEYAARSGSTTAYACGESERCLFQMGWYDGNAEGKTHPVGQKQPNAWGLFDMHGNVQEWVQDWYGNYPGSDVKDPQGAGSGSGRGVRGGGWDGNAQYARSAIRGEGSPGTRSNGLGFRLVRGQ